jgi:hypothetical protein
MTDLDTLARAATRELLERTTPDLPTRYAELRRIRTRRTTAKIAGLAAAVAVAAGWQLLGHGRGHDDIRPIGPVHLDLHHARPAAPQVLAEVRTYQPGQTLDHDRFDGITDDGLVVRSRFTFQGDISEYGLLDPTTGSTDWLPRPTWDLGDPVPLRLSADRLVYLENRHAPDHFGLLVFDRTDRTWHRSTFDEPPGVDRFFGFTAHLGDDDRVYLMDPAQPVRWFSVGLDGTGLREEPDLDGQSLAFSDIARITADLDGRVVVIRQGGEGPQVVEEELPDGCHLDEGWRPDVRFAGDRAVVSLPCREGHRLTVYEPDGTPYLTLAGRLTLGGAGPERLLLTTKRQTYSLDLDQRELFQVDVANAGGYLGGADVVGDLAVWGVDGPTPLKERSFDLVYKVGQLP